MFAGLLMFAASPIGRYVTIFLVAAIVIGGVLLYVYGKGEAAGAAAIVAAGLAEGARRAAAAQRARDAVKSRPEDIENDEDNLDRRP